MDEISNYVHIDHISFRKEGLTPHEAATEIGLNHHWPFEKCINPLPSFYEEACGFDNIIICHHGLDQKGVAITFSGKGCSTFERESPIGWEALRKIAIAPDAHTTRLDIAYDDFTGILDIRKLKELRDSGRYTSLLRVNSEIRSSKKIEDGLTVSFGSSKSNVYIRFYDKAAEQKMPEKHWVRAEIQLRNENADNALRAGFSLDILDVLFASLMDKYLRFKDKSLTDSNPSRWSLAAFWEDFVLIAQPIRLTRPKDSAGGDPDSRIKNFINIARSLAGNIGWPRTFNLLCEAAKGKTDTSYHWLKEDESFYPAFIGCRSLSNVELCKERSST